MGIVGRKRHPISKGGRIAKTFSSEKELQEALSTCCPSKKGSKGESKKAKLGKKSGKTEQKEVQASDSEDKTGEESSEGESEDDVYVSKEENIKGRNVREIKVVTLKSTSQEKPKPIVIKKLDTSKAKPKSPQKQVETSKADPTKRKIEAYLQNPKGSGSEDDDSQSKKNSSFQAVFESVIAKQMVVGPQKRSAAATNIKKSSSSVDEKGDSNSESPKIKSEPDIKKRKMSDVPDVSFQNQLVQHAQVMRKANDSVIVMKPETVNKKSVSYLGTNFSPVVKSGSHNVQYDSENTLPSSSTSKVKGDSELPVDLVERHKDLGQELIQLTHDIISQQSNKTQRFGENGNNVMKNKATSVTGQVKLESDVKQQVATGTEFGKNASSNSLTFSQLALQAQANKYKSSLGGSDMNLQSTINRLSTALHTKAPSGGNNLLGATSEAIPDSLSVDVTTPGIITTVQVPTVGMKSPKTILKQEMKSPPPKAVQTTMGSSVLARENVKSPNTYVQQNNPNIDIVKIQSPKGTQSIVHIHSPTSQINLNKPPDIIHTTAASSSVQSASASVSSPANIVPSMSSPLLTSASYKMPPNIAQSMLASPNVSNIPGSPPLLSPAIPSTASVNADTYSHHQVTARSPTTNVGVIQMNQNYSKSGTLSNPSKSVVTASQGNPSFSSVIGHTSSSNHISVINSNSGSMSHTSDSMNQQAQRHSLGNTMNDVNAGIISTVNNINQIGTNTLDQSSANVTNTAINVQQNPGNIRTSAGSVVNINNRNNQNSVIQTQPVYSMGQILNTQNMHMISNNQGLNQTVNPRITQPLNSGVVQAVQPGLVQTVNPGLVQTLNSGVVQTVNSGVVQAVNPGMVQTVNSGMVQNINPGVVQTLNSGMAQTVNPGVVQTVNPRVVQAVNSGMVQSVNPGVVQTVDSGMVQAVNPGVVQTLNSGVVQSVNPGVVQTINPGVAQTINSGMVQNGMIIQQPLLHAQAAAQTLAQQSNMMNRLSSPQNVPRPNQNFLGQVPVAMTLQGNTSSQVMQQNLTTGSQQGSGTSGQYMQQRLVSNGNQTFLVNLPVVGTHITTSTSTGNVVVPTSNAVTASLPQGRTQQLVGQFIIQDPKTKTLKIVPQVMNPNVLKAVNPNTKQVKLVTLKSGVSNQMVSRADTPVTQQQLLIPLPSGNTSTKSKGSLKLVPATVNRSLSVSELLKASARQSVAATALSTASVQGLKSVDNGSLPVNTPAVKLLAKPVLANIPVTTSNFGKVNTQNVGGLHTSQSVMQSSLSSASSFSANPNTQGNATLGFNDSQISLSVCEQTVNSEVGTLNIDTNASSVKTPGSLISPSKISSTDKSLQLVPQPIVPISQTFSNSYTSTLPTTTDDQPIHNYAMPAQLFEEDSNDAKPPNLELEAPTLEIEAPILKLENELDMGNIKGESDPDNLANFSLGSGTVNQLSSGKSELDVLPQYSSVSDGSQTLVQTTSYGAFVGTGEAKPKKKRQKSGTRDKDGQDQASRQKVAKLLQEYSGSVGKGKQDSKEPKVKPEGTKKRERFSSGEEGQKKDRKRHNSAGDETKKRERFNSGETGKKKAERKRHTSGEEDKVKGKRKQNRMASPEKYKLEQKPKETIGEFLEEVIPEIAEPWAVPVSNLWQHKPHDFDAEMAFNERFSQQDPHCCICALFTPFKLYSEAAKPEAVKPIKKTSKKKLVPQRTLPMIPEMCFASSTDNPNPFGSNTILDKDGLSPVLVCEDCKVCVHSSCYGVAADGMSKWRCARCVGQHLSAVCCLCTLRGGALKPTSDGRWAHIICALTIREVKFEHIQKREPINVSQVMQAKKAKCQFCGHQTLGICVQCSNRRCSQAFHVTCAYVAGVVFETSDWPYPVYMTCLKHAGIVRNRNQHERELTQLEVGCKVIAKHRNTRYYKVEVLEREDQVFYEVDFDDGSFSNDLFPEDIHNHNPERGPPAVGKAIKVKWTDGSLYGATFRGINRQDMYTVEFDDASQRVLPREELWLDGEELPKHIQSRLSCATERKYDYFYKKEVVDENVKGHSIRPKQKISYSALLSSTMDSE